MKEKYILEEYPLYFKFGESADGSIVDVASTQHDTIVSVTKAQANLLIEDHNKAIDKLVSIAMAFSNANPEEFDKAWKENV